MKKLGAAFIAMPGHKGLLGPQGTGILLCGQNPQPLLCGGTGSDSLQQQMPSFLPDRGEAGTLNVPGIAGLRQGLLYVKNMGLNRIRDREHEAAALCAAELRRIGIPVFSGRNQGGTVSCLPNMDCQIAAEALAKRGIAVRAGLHCAPLAHESAGTLESGTLRISFGVDASAQQVAFLLRAMQEICCGN